MEPAPVIPDDPTGIEDVLKELKKNFKTGKTRSAEFRKNALNQLIKGYEELKEQISEAQRKDLGWNTFLSEILTHGVTVNEIKDLRDNLKGWMKQESISTPMVLGLASSSVVPEPLGVALVLSAWNYPIYTSIPQVAAAISAGNCVILKPSEVAPHSSKVITKLFDKYMDKDFFRCIEGKVEVAKAISKLPFDIICFTGSTFTGRLVGIEAAKNLIPCILELGGKCPIIVDETAKIESAVLRILMGKFLNCGQTCVGVDHVYVHSSIYNTFKQTLLLKANEGYGNHQNYEDEHYGKIISDARVKRLQQLLKDNHGGKILFGGTIHKEKRYISPTIVENPKKTSLMMQEEIFGPIMPLYSYEKLEDLITEINDRPKPLVVYVFSESSKNVQLVKENTFSGAFVVNETVMQMANNHLPFGGVGGSGYGRYHGKYGFDAFSNMKSIVYSKAANPYPLSCRFPPYTESNKNLLMKLMKTGSMTYGQLGKAMLLLFTLVAIGLIVGLVVVPAIKN